MEKIAKKINILTILKIILLSIVVLLIGINFVSQKENLAIDETYTYGLANSSFQADIEDFKEYTGEELFFNYASVNKEHRFDIGNVFFNQKMDTHPPLYYLLVNFICSLNPGKFSMWYGLIINVILLIVVFWEMRYLLNIIINDKISASLLTLISFFTYGFTNAIVFTRMYMLLLAFSMGFIILILKKINDPKSNNISFFIKYFLLCLGGVLTQYHFAIIACFFSAIFAINLIKNKDFKLLILTILIGVASLFTCYLIFPAMINHILGGETLHSLINENTTSIATNFIEMLITIKTGIFGNGIYAYLSILFLLLIINFFIFKRKKDITLKSLFNSYYLYFLLACIFYYIIISLTTTFTFERYLYNIYPLLFIVILTPIYFLLKNIKNPLKYITIAIIIMLAITSTIKKAPHNLCVGDSLFEEYLNNIKDTKTILLYHSVDKNGNLNTMGGTSKWKIPYPFYLFRHMKNMTFVDTGYIEKLYKSTDKSISGHDDIVLVIYTNQDDETLINALMEKNNVTNAQKLYFTTYIHVYRLTK